MAVLSLISINVEKDCHNDAVEQFLREHSPDVACFQEVRPEDVERFARVLGAETPLYVSATRELTQGRFVTWGNAIISKTPLIETRVQHFMGDPDTVRDSDQDDEKTFNYTNRMLLSARVEKEGVDFHVSTTHFTWSAKGQASDEQRQSMKKLLDILSNEKEFVLCGDFNAPRGGEIFDMLASRYKDNIPPEYKTSIYAPLHRAGKTHEKELGDKMVDGLFSTPGYRAFDVQLTSGISDHYAISAKIEKLA